MTLAVVGLVFAVLVIVNPSSPSAMLFVPLMILFVVLSALLLIDIERSRRRNGSR
ncbi:hypothetical protein [Luethyella okanaganae]|uniref:Uncharacterized protein n=1 Tax=Luethyella okanaganae TaxID=69372 RepID=A0ABW1VFM4_9MICO